MRDPHYDRMCFKSQLKPSEFNILSCDKSLGLWPRLFTAKNVELFGLYPILKSANLSKMLSYILKLYPKLICSEFSHTMITQVIYFSNHVRHKSLHSGTKNTLLWNLKFRKFICSFWGIYSKCTYRLHLCFHAFDDVSYLICVYMINLWNYAGFFHVLINVQKLRRLFFVFNSVAMSVLDTWDLVKFLDI